MTICFAGLSHLGIIHSLATTAKGFEVIGFDPNNDLCHQLSEGKFPISEPGLSELFTKHRSQCRFTSEVSDLKKCQLIFASLDVATHPNNQSDLNPLNELLEKILPSIPSDSVLVILSQVPPGFTSSLKTKIEATPSNPQLFYQVETLIFGNAVERALQPERYIIGCNTPEKPLPEVYSEWLNAFQCPILPMHYESAELTKIAINMFLVSSVSTTNTIANLCEKIGARWHEIAPALKLDKRIGPHAYLSPGLGLAGGNLERDLVTFQTLANQHGTDSEVVHAWQNNSHYRRHWVLRELSGRLPKASTPSQIAVWGLAYKINTNSIKNSQSIELLQATPHLNKRVYDPQVRLDKSFSIPSIIQVEKPIEACTDASVLIVMTPWPEFKNVNLQRVAEAMPGRIIIDPFGVLNGVEAKKLGFDYIQLGC